MHYWHIILKSHIERVKQILLMHLVGPITTKKKGKRRKRQELFSADPLAETLMECLKTQTK
jgi:hypothetical protein